METTMNELTEWRIEHRDGISYEDAPLPRRWHRCSPWTTGRKPSGVIFRCACGAIAYSDTSEWFWVNDRRRVKWPRRPWWMSHRPVTPGKGK